MPEFAECWALGYALSKLGIVNKVIGKHLIIGNLDYSFGLNGRIIITDDLKITHTGYGIHGKVVELDSNSSNSKLGLNFIDCKESELEKVVKSWTKGRKKIASLLLDQHEIAGIGVAWGSEILHLSSINPDTSIKDIPENTIDLLIKNMCIVRDNIISLYKNTVDKLGERKELLNFINGWFKNLYLVRDMKVYDNKEANKVKVGGRIFWIK